MAHPGGHNGQHLPLQPQWRQEIVQDLESTVKGRRPPRDAVHDITGEKLAPGDAAPLLDGGPDTAPYLLSHGPHGREEGLCVAQCDPERPEVVTVGVVVHGYGGRPVPVGFIVTAPAIGGGGQCVHQVVGRA
jgi:hypothetical protein